MPLSDVSEPKENVEGDRGIASVGLVAVAELRRKDILDSGGAKAVEEKEKEAASSVVRDFFF